MSQQEDDQELKVAQEKVYAPRRIWLELLRDDQDWSQTPMAAYIGERIRRFLLSEGPVVWEVTKKDYRTLSGHVTVGQERLEVLHVTQDEDHYHWGTLQLVLVRNKAAAIFQFFFADYPGLVEPEWWELEMTEG